MKVHSEKNYYLSVKPKIMEGVEEVEAYLKRVLRRYFDGATTTRLLRETRFGFEELLPQLPYIGGEANVLTASLIRSAWCLPLFRAMEREGLALREIAKIGYEQKEHDVESKSPEKKRHVKEFYFSPAMKKVEMQKAKESQSGKYPEDWVTRYVEGDGKAFDFGIDFTECALYNFFKPRDALKYLPIFCMGDYATYRAFGIGFKRTKTIANGEPFCDFRFKSDWTTPRGWPPEALEETFSF